MLSPDEQGHYFAEVAINGHRERGIIDTGATHLSMSRATASAMKIPYEEGQRGSSQTAAGSLGVWLVRVPRIQLNTITLYDVDVVVRDVRGDSPLLIGSSLLNRFDMERDQSMLVMRKKP
jgi:aspartyl protease family protein